MSKFKGIAAVATMMTMAGSAMAQSIPTVPAGAPVAGPVALGALVVVVAAAGAYALRRK